MRDYFELGTTPYGEDCVQVSSKVDYLDAMREECKRFKAMLEKRFPNKPQGCSFSLKSSEHDFDTYYDVVINYDDEDDEQYKYALLVEGNMPEFWSDNEIILN